MTDAVRQIVTSVGWQVGGGGMTGTCTSAAVAAITAQLAGANRCTTVQTAVEGVSAPPTDAAVVVDVLPSPVQVARVASTADLWRPVVPAGGSGPAGVITARISVERWNYAGQMRVRWTNDDGQNKSFLVNKSGDEWVATIPATTNPDPAREIRARLDSEEEGFIDLLFEPATGGTSLSATYRLALFGYNQYAPGFTIYPTPVPVNWHQQHGCQGTNRCRNTVNTWLVATLPSDVPSNTTVAVSWVNPAQTSVSLRRDTNNPSTWYAVVVADGLTPHPNRPWETATRQWMPGDLTFTITVREGTTIVSETTYVRKVVVQ